jgi:hypothetical protein
MRVAQISVGARGKHAIWVHYCFIMTLIALCEPYLIDYCYYNSAKRLSKHAQNNDPLCVHCALRETGNPELLSTKSLTQWSGSILGMGISRLKLFFIHPLHTKLNQRTSTISDNSTWQIQQCKPTYFYNKWQFNVTNSTVLINVLFTINDNSTWQIQQCKPTYF